MDNLIPIFTLIIVATSLAFGVYVYLSEKKTRRLERRVYDIQLRKERAKTELMLLRTTIEQHKDSLKTKQEKPSLYLYQIGKSLLSATKAYPFIPLYLWDMVTEIDLLENEEKT